MKYSILQAMVRDILAIPVQPIFRSPQLALMEESWVSIVHIRSFNVCMKLDVEGYAMY